MGGLGETDDHGADGATWSLLCDAVAAAHAGDNEAYVAALTRLGRDLPKPDIRSGAFVRYLLRYRVAQMLSREPDAADVAALARQARNRFSELIKVPNGLDAVLLTAFELAPDDRKVSGADGVVLGAAALGVLLDEPAVDMAAMRPHLDAWWATIKDDPELHEEGRDGRA